jgi:hypothetical protein
MEPGKGVDLKPLECVDLIKHFMEMGIHDYIAQIRGVRTRAPFELEIQMWDKGGSVLVKSSDTELIRLIVHHFKRQKFTVAEDHPTFVQIFRRRS